MPYSSLSVHRVKRILKTPVFSNLFNMGSIQVSNAAIMLLLYLLLARKVGLLAFGEAMLANYLANLIGVVVNFGTGQSGVKDIANAKTDRQKLAGICSGVIVLRTTVFIIFLLGFFTWRTFIPGNNFLLFALPLVLAEVINPLMIYLGREELARYNLANLAGKLLILALVILFINTPVHAIWINFILGSVQVAVYFYLAAYAVWVHKLRMVMPGRSSFGNLVKNNFYILGNNLSVTLQQSLMVFALGAWKSPWLGAYSLCDKIAWSGRLLIISVCNSVYPKGALLFTESALLFNAFKKRTRRLLFAGFATLSVLLFLFAAPIIRLMAGHPDPAAITLLRITAFLQVVAALNSFNVIELLIRNRNVYIFRIGLVLVLVASALSAATAGYGNLYLLGSYPILVELAALLMYEYVIRIKTAQLTTA